MDQIEQVRDFNRYYTQRLGVLTDHYLGQGRPLGEARLLFEIGAGAGVGLRDLRARLGLDSGYLSRLLRSLSSQGLVAVGPSPADGRVRIATLTEAGRRERDDLEARSRESVAALLGPLTDAQREQLVEAQARIRRLLRLAAVVITPVADDDPAARACLTSYGKELALRFPEGYDPAALTAPGTLGSGTMLLAREEDAPVGCGLWILLGSFAEIRHLWVSPAARGCGLGARLLTGLERDAAAHGVTVLRLGTHPALTEAIALYRRHGYREIAAYDSSPYNQLSFEKELVL
ncbi:PadR family transcriptional regulator [Paractinoplanes abujensis]|uniref:DNA-binding MarR family transcriptional regulator/GNAT superfamily N-acetyltransferase n=1 Tax=Paractinoplanes abujensis TaxID=882441 RepID=A0A7W7CTY2_9ACTN|nr:helix-turn-helix domain-containing GNAT family N-acetyltransferase [Actinoplanes abujensis]MBB4694339.1 DNA-binding MarR family transcriptional regulator/GNAT superfamily N-acetyltransferase [Actinoplanes abujensis]GID20446.1 PadR family transcriptional regulator [Actinoplanes abujensis]